LYYRYKYIGPTIGLLTRFWLETRRTQSCRVYSKMMPNVGVGRARPRDIILLLLSARRLLYTTILILLYTSTRRRPHTHTHTYLKHLHIFSIRGYIQCDTGSCELWHSHSVRDTFTLFVVGVHYIILYTYARTHTHTHISSRDGNRFLQTTFLYIS